MFASSSNSVSSASSRPVVRFGLTPAPLAKSVTNATSEALPTWIKPVDFLYAKVLNTRTKEMLLEDLVGFGLLRTAIDLYRQRIMGKGETDAHGHQELNIPAARERLLRESGSILTDNISGGVFAFAVAVLANQFGVKSLSQKFVGDKTLALFERVIQDIPSDNLLDKPRFEKAFLNQLATEMRLPADALTEAYEKWPQRKEIPAFNEYLSKIIRENHPQAEGFQLASKKLSGAFPLPELLEDSHHLVQSLPNQAVSSQSMAEQAQRILSKSKGMNKIQYLGILGALGLTFAVPFAIQSLTRKLDGFANYPGDKGIRRMVSVDETKDKSWFAQHFPYISDAIYHHKATALLPLIPLLFALGLFDTQALSRFAFKEAFNAPWKKEFIPRLKEMYQFGKGFPFTTQQQMASCFAFLIFSRMMTARSDVEFRERSVDSLLGWTTWILGTPLLKRGISKLIERQFTNVKLFNSAGGLRSFDEIKLFPGAGNVKSSLVANRLINFVSMLFSIGTLGILEPIFAIKWTAHRAKTHSQDEPLGSNHQFSQLHQQALQRANPFRISFSMQ